MHAAHLHLLAVNHQSSVDLEEGQGFVLCQDGFVRLPHLAVGGNHRIASQRIQLDAQRREQALDERGDLREAF